MKQFVMRLLTKILPVPELKDKTVSEVDFCDRSKQLIGESKSIIQYKFPFLHGR